MLRIHRAQLPPELAQINPHLLELLLPDISVTVDPHADRTSASSATFTVTLSPGVLASDGFLYPDVVIEDLSLPLADRVVWEVRGLRMRRTGGSTTMKAEWDMPPDAVFDPDFHNELKIIVDSADEITERTKRNNLVTFWGTTLG